MCLWSGDILEKAIVDRSGAKVLKSRKAAETLQTVSKRVANNKWQKWKYQNNCVSH